MLMFSNFYFTEKILLKSEKKYLKKIEIILEGFNP